MIDLRGKNALVTGGGRGIGYEIAATFAAAGCNVAVSDIDSDSVQAAATKVENSGVQSLGLTGDVSSVDNVRSMYSAFFEKFPTLDILINNAGITRDTLCVRMKEEDWDLVLKVNLKGAFVCCKEAMRPMMKARGGKIINIASIVGIIGNAGQANYSASKAGIIGLTKSLAKELASRSITVNAVAPGFIKTSMTDSLPESEREKLAAAIPLQRLGSPSDVANVVLFLASPLADYITGEVIRVDGGMVM
jgi:3-oxoacyl-[acyl-carrier protein] reductase